MTDVEDVFFKGIGINQDIIEIGDSKLVEELMDDIVDVGLERTGGVAKTKRHDEVFEVTITGMKGCFELISMFDSEAIEGFADIEFGEVLCTFKSVHHLGDQRQGVTILDGDVV